MDGFKLPLSAIINELYQKYECELKGEVSNAFPALQSVDPDLFAISVVTCDGKTIHVGDYAEPFTIQSISKPFTFGLALERHGSRFVEEKIGMEPTGEDFDSIIKLDDKMRPYNPMVNSGAILTSSLIKSSNGNTREEEVLQWFSKFAGKKLNINHEVFLSECKHAHKNWAIAHLLRHFGLGSKNFKEDLELYFKQCSIELNCDLLAMMGATLANNGVNPLTNESCLAPINLRSLLSIIFTCGMYNYSGEWAYDVGLPAKSGISGTVLMIVPGFMAISVYSPRLDKRGNSIRGIRVCEELSNRLNLHFLDANAPESLADLY